MSTSRRIRWSSLPASGLTVIALGFGLLLCAAAQAQRTATAEATVVKGFVVAITVTDGGAGYGTAPGVTIVGGGGSSATAKATVLNGTVEKVIVENAGSGYATAPEVLIAPPDLVMSTLSIKMVSQLTIYGEVGSTNQVQWVNAFGDTNTWVALTNIVLPGTPFIFYDTISPQGVQRFYRAVAQKQDHPTAPPTPDTNKFAWIQSGTFTMGSSVTEQDRKSDEDPQTRVTISKGFWMSRYETTQEEYLGVMGTNPSYFKGDTERPVEVVSWIDATNYCAKMTVLERAAGRLPAGYVYRLPTEAEWEYACRAGTTTATAYGNSLSSAQANFNGDFPYGGAAKGPNLGRTTKVGSYPANAWGLYDMPGNVYEWCSDWYGDYPGGSVTDPRGPATGANRVLRGGGWYRYGFDCRSANRYNHWPDSASSGFGFRPVLAPGQ